MRLYHQAKSVLLTHTYPICFGLVGLVYAANLFTPVMDVDAAQYASISMEMSQTGNWLQVHERGADYLDKPPLLFWLSALSMTLFGVNTLAYKLPALLVLLLGLYALYRFVLHFYGRPKALLATLIFSSTQAFCLMSNDIRTDGLLTGLVITALWQLMIFVQQGKPSNLLWGAIATAAALLAKGPLGIVLIGFGLGGDWLLKRNWRQLIRPVWLLYLALVLLLLLPMCYGLYQQFDAHPQKGVSGLRFYFWTQSFGRITGESIWNNHAPPHFFLQTIAWDFQPWAFLLIPAFGLSLRRLWQARFRLAANQEGAMLSLFLLGLAALSLSRFKLPHYVFPLFPAAAVVVAHGLVELSHNHLKYWLWIQTGLMQLFFIVIAAGLLCFFPPPVWVWWLLPVSGFLAFWTIVFWHSHLLHRTVFATLLAGVSFSMFMSVYIYPRLLAYQAGSVAGHQMHNQPAGTCFFAGSHPHSLDFYAGRLLPQANMDSLANYPKGTLIYTDDAYKRLIPTLNGHYAIADSLPDFRITTLTLTFLNKETRPQTLGWRYLLRKTN